MKRRDFQLGVVALASSLGWPRAYAEDGLVKLIVIRRRGYANSCTRCIPGKLYGVPVALDLNSAESVTPLLYELSDTIELGYEDNATGRSSIPTQTYDASVRTDGTKPWMWSGGAVGSGSIRLDRAWRLELQNVPGNRSAIQFHYGRDVSWSEGCVILGTSPPTCRVDECRHQDSSESAVRRIRDYVTQNGLSSRTRIQVRITDSLI